MKDYDYFTFITAGDEEIGLGKPAEYWLQSDDGLLTLYFTLPTEAPVELRGLPASVEVYDPTYFVAFEFVDDNPVKLEDAPATCKFSITRPPDMDAASRSPAGRRRRGTAGSAARAPGIDRRPGRRIARVPDAASRPQDRRLRGPDPSRGHRGCPRQFRTFRRRPAGASPFGRRRFPRDRRLAVGLLSPAHRPRHADEN